jgi:hypothetical protein
MGTMALLKPTVADLVFIPLSKSGQCNVPLQAVALKAKFGLFAARLVNNSAASLKTAKT